MDNNLEKWISGIFDFLSKKHAIDRESVAELIADWEDKRRMA